jgi:prepilin-type processing-associated H-X9-DG protein
LGWVSGTRATLRNTGSIQIGRLVAFGPAANAGAGREADIETVGGFGSEHSGGIANFVMADGAVVSLTESIDPDVFRRLGNRADGELLGANEF